jgi:hypothetical protein
MKVIDWVEQQVYKVIESIVQIVQTVCENIYETIETWEKGWEQQCETVQKKVCKWLPWPLSDICNWVTETVCKLVEVWFKVVKTIVHTVCEVITSFVKIIILVPMTILVAVARIICFIIDFIASWVKIIIAAILGIPEFILCMLGVRPRKYLHACVTILAGEGDRAVVTDAQVDDVIREARRIMLRRFNVSLRIHGRKTVRVPDSNLDVEACDAGQLFSSDAVDLSSEGNRGTFGDLTGCGGLFDLSGGPLADVLNIIFIRNIIEGDDIGCHIPGTDYVIIDQTAAGLTLAHELGHAGDLWHIDEDDNLMNHNTAGEEVHAWQQCILRRSRFVVYVP